MGSVSLTGNDTTILDGRIFSDLADGDCVSLEVPNNISDGKVGKNGNLIIALNVSGKTVNVTMRIIAGSADDKWMNSRYAAFVNDTASFSLFSGTFIKRVGDGQGNVNNVQYNLGQGFPQKMPVAKENKEGDTEQSVSVWVLTFPNTDRAIV